MREPVMTIDLSTVPVVGAAGGALTCAAAALAGAAAKKEIKAPVSAVALRKFRFVIKSTPLGNVSAGLPDFRLGINGLGRATRIFEIDVSLLSLRGLMLIN